MTDDMVLYSGLLNAVGMSLLLTLIAVFYVSLTLEAFKGASEGRSAASALSKGGAGVDCRPGDDEIRPSAPRLRQIRASLRA